MHQGAEVEVEEGAVAVGAFTGVDLEEAVVTTEVAGGAEVDTKTKNDRYQFVQLWYINIA